MSDKADDTKEDDMAPLGNTFAEGCETSGRPTKYKEEYNEQVRKLCLLGATDEDIADFFEVCVDTINAWKKKYEEFSASASRGKLIADMEVVESLYKTTQDRTVLEQQAFKVKVGQFEESVEIVEIEKVIPADFRAQQLWLKNRRAAYWKDKQEVGVTDKDGNDVTPSITVFQIPDNGRASLNTNNG